tara:strand:- start:3258 stop:3716 length:459 start_codon:yes stop_codon:yes gene_type:complete
MRYYKFVGTERDAVDYHDKSLKVANIYREDDLVRGKPVKTFATDDDFPDIMAEWKEVSDVDYNLQELRAREVKSTEGKVDQVNCPSHYNKGDVECIEAIKSATVGKKGIEAVCVANVIKYLWRYEEKGKPLQDVQKAKWYLEKLLNEIKDEK